MTDILETGVTWLNEVRNTHFVKTVTYRRGLAFIDISATRGQTRTTIANDEGVEIAGQIDDWIITASDLVLSGSQAYPQEGDKICETLGSQVFTYRVQRGPDGELWRYSDSFKQSMRIHTIRVATDGG